MKDNKLGRIEVRTLALPEDMQIASATYTYTGKILLVYPGQEDRKDDYRIAIANEEGSDIHEIFSGVIPQHPKANGIRFMPFQDNKRVLLGDYVLECQPDLDHCVKAKLVPLIYPAVLVDSPYTMAHWSEIIIAPDNRHMSFTALRTDIGSICCIGCLKREEECYNLENIQIISTLESFQKEKEEGFIIPQVIRGGEVKQFVHGGRAISSVGQKKGVIPNSVVQDLETGEVEQITHTPGYDETTIFSPDERLGLVMSTRGSERTNPAVFGLVPRPHGIHAASGLSMHLYMYSVAGVRSGRKGNVGPVLIEIERSIKEEGYLGVQLHDPEAEWVYLSPMSWHPDGRHGMWPEMLRGSGSGGKRPRIRIRIVELLEYEPAASVPIVATPEDILYGSKDLSILSSKIDTDIKGKIRGKHSGYIEYTKQASAETPGMLKSKYVDFSDDGLDFYRGYEKTDYSHTGECTYEADFTLSGKHQGEMKLKAVFSAVREEEPVRLLFDPADDGKPKSYGYASYNGVRLTIEDMLE